MGYRGKFRFIARERPINTASYSWTVGEITCIACYVVVVRRDPTKQWHLNIDSLRGVPAEASSSPCGHSSKTDANSSLIEDSNLGWWLLHGILGYRTGAFTNSPNYIRVIQPTKCTWRHHPKYIPNPRPQYSFPFNIPLDLFSHKLSKSTPTSHSGQ